MVAIGSKHFYVFEFARLRDGRFIVPERWVKYKGKLHAEAFEVDFSGGKASIRDEKTTLVGVSELKDNFYDLQEQDLLPDCDGEASTLLALTCAEKIVAQHGPTRHTQKQCLIQTGSLQAGHHCTPVLPTISQMTSRAIGQSLGTNTGTSILRTETSPGATFNKNSMSI